MIQIKYQQGVTLVEVMLVFVVMTLIAISGFRLYDFYRHDVEMNQIRANVSQILQGMAYYYQANCSSSKTADDNVKKPGTLDPSNNLQPWVPITMIQLQPYLTAPIPVNPLLGPSPYVMQFNRLEPPPDRMIARGDGTTPPYKIGKIILWTAQVAVKLSSEDEAQQYKNLLAADCVSSYSDSYVFPCSSSSAGKGDYIVWERWPSFTGSENTPVTWQQMKVLQQFNQMYSTYPINYLTDGTITNQNYLCGS